MKKNNPHISVVSPVYRAENIVRQLVKRISEEVEKITNNYEIILVEDSSPDNSWEAIKEICKENRNVVGIRLSRNFGQHEAISAGLEKSKGDYVVVMDCDLQDNPKYIIKMYKEINNDVDIVLTKKIIRNQSFYRRITGRLFFKMYNWFSGSKFDPNIGGFSIISRKVVEAYNSLHEYKKYYLLALSWLGYSVKIIEVQNDKRLTENSSYKLSTLLTVALISIISNSNKLLRFSISIGLFFVVASLFAVFFLLVQILLLGANYLLGWPSVIITLFFSTGIILFSLGVLGIYLGEIFDQVKDRPRYIIKEELNGE